MKYKIKEKQKYRIVSNNSDQKYNMNFWEKKNNSVYKWLGVVLLFLGLILVFYYI